MSKHGERALELFHAACDLPEPEREAFLERASSGDAPLLREVRELIERDGALDAGPPRALPAGDAAPEPPPEIAGYELLERLASGSSGDVFLAAQRAPRRHVAIKLLRSGWIGERERERFAREAEILARLDHPAVARVIEAGVAGAGASARPYLVMEYVDGVAPAEFARSRGLGRAERLLLLAAIADGVAHAHARGVIHRDLKQANVIVDAAGAPHVVDFGIARPSAPGGPVETVAGQLLGTLSTMSPEQASGDPRRVDVRTDIYALGVIACEVLAGRLPLEFGDEPLSRSLRRIEEEVPPRLGTLDPALRGEIEAVVAKALEKEPDRRYASAAELAADLRRAARGEPVLAAPPSAWRALACYARRHRAAVALAALAGLCLIATSVGACAGLLEARGQARRAERERAAAERSRDGTESVLACVERLLQLPEPMAAGPDARMTTVLGLWEAEVARGLEQQPFIEARVRSLLASTFFSLGKYREAGECYRRASELYAAARGPDSDEAVLSVLDRVGSALALADFAEAESLVAAYLAALERRGDASAVDLALGRLAEVDVLLHQERGAEASARLAALAPDVDRIFGPDSEQAAQCCQHAARCAQLAGDLAAACAGLQRGIAIRERLGQPWSELLMRRTELAHVLRGAGELDAALKLLEQCEAQGLAMLDERHPVLLGIRMYRVRALVDASSIPEALELAESVVAALRAPENADLPMAINVLAEYGDILMTRGHLDQAEAALREAIERAERCSLDDSSLAVDIKLRLGLLLGGRGNLAGGIELMEAALKQLERWAGSSGNEEVARAKMNLAQLYDIAGNAERAEPMYRESFAILAAARPPEHPVHLNAEIMLARFLGRHGQEAEAMERLASVVAVAGRSLGADHLTTLRATLFLAQIEVGTGAAAAAVERLEPVLATYQAKLPAFSEEVSAVADALEEAYRALGRTADVIALLEQRRAIAEVELAPDDPRRAALDAALEALHDGS